MEPRKCARIAWFVLSDLPADIPDYERVVLEGIGAGRIDLITSVGFD
ncbi:hypothetical protein [Microbacterium telephonicum]|nr:hypothetical protein [Microbacterium telephonicum]